MLISDNLLQIELGVDSKLALATPRVRSTRRTDALCRERCDLLGQRTRAQVIGKRI